MYSRKVYFAGQLTLLSQNMKRDIIENAGGIFMHVRDNLLFSEKYSAPQNKWP